MSDTTALDDQVFRIGMSREEAARQPDQTAPFGRDDKGEPIAPFGLRQDGGVKLKPGRTAGPGSRTPAARGRPAAPRGPQKRRGRPASPRGGSSSPSRAPKRGSADYRAAIGEVADTAYKLLIWAGEKDRVFYADAAVVVTIRDPLADGLAPLVADVPWLAKAVAWWGDNAKYTGVSLALSQAAAQITANHVPALRDRLVTAGLAVEPDQIAAGVELELLRQAAADRDEAAAAAAQIEALRAKLSDDELRKVQQYDQEQDQRYGPSDPTDRYGPPAPPDLVGPLDHAARLA